MEDIERSFLESDRVWPVGLTTDQSHPFVSALVEVLKRLSDKDYDKVELRIGFVVESYQMRAVNVPFRQIVPPATQAACEVRYDTIIVFASSLRLPHPALVGLLAHEIAHSCVEKDDHHDNEAAADQLATSWGFGQELQALEDADGM